jgi:hypothetical protein
MPFVAKLAIATLLMSVALTPLNGGAQTVPPSNADQNAGTTTSGNGPPHLTGKERLGEKWKDEQRMNNYKVPLDKRGTKPRPDNCAHPPTG